MATRLELPQFNTLQVHAQAIMLIGVGGHSATYEAVELARYITNEGFVHHITKPDDKTGITITQIRELYTATRAKSVGTKRVWILENAETMSLDAQNAFLKLLEEPPTDVVFILCVKTATDLLPTIRSRVQPIQCKPLSRQLAQHYLLEKGVPPQIIPKLLFLAAGSASELQALAENESYRQKQLELAAIAKQFISAPNFDKIIIAQKVSGNREQALTVIRLSLQMLKALAPKQAEHKVALEQLARLLEAYERVSQNGNTKVQLLRAIL